MAERCSWLHQCRKTSIAFRRFSHRRRGLPELAVRKGDGVGAAGQGALCGCVEVGVHPPMATPREVASPTICNPVTLPPRVGQLTPQSGTAEDLRGLTDWPAAWPNRCTRCRRYWTVPFCRSGWCAFVSPAWWELTMHHPASAIPGSQSALSHRAEASERKEVQKGRPRGTPASHSN
jgi:hypothetical protein